MCYETGQFYLLTTRHFGVGGCRMMNMQGLLILDEQNFKEQAADSFR